MPAYKTDAEGRLLFFRWGGFFGKGYIIPNESKEQEIRRFLKLYYMVVLAVVIATGVTVGWVFNFFLLPLFYLWYFLTFARLLKGLAVTGERLTLRESFSSSAKSHSIVNLWMMLIFSIILVLGAFALVLYAPDAWLMDW